MLDRLVFAALCWAPPAEPGHDMPGAAEPAAPAEWAPDERSPEADPGTSPAAAAPPVAPRFPEPARVVPRAAPVRRSPPSRYVGRQRLIRPALRVMPGVAVRPTQAPRAAFGLDVLGSVLVGLRPGERQFGIGPEVGYALRAPDAGHDLIAGLSFVYGINADYASFGLLPRAVLRADHGDLEAGVRTGLWYDFAENGFSVELSHQWTTALDPAAVEVRDQHELRLTIGIDLLMLAIVLNRNWRVGFI